ncbi:hypothetical protein DVZ84_38400 [Streptomyces parvulus]|uniref:Uncharacterized protein n=1 Tax=Streptomyces parvulus TaxID=146923 RepID=A0A369USW8_9ACTN|nr:hypothetical protein DVZ84_38400 [Streptomyces parvulus]
MCTGRERDPARYGRPAGRTPATGTAAAVRAHPGGRAGRAGAAAGPGGAAPGAGGGCCAGRRRRSRC